MNLLEVMDQHEVTNSGALDEASFVIYNLNEESFDALKRAFAGAGSFEEFSKLELDDPGAEEERAYIVEEYDDKIFALLKAAFAEAVYTDPFDAEAEGEDPL